MRNLLGAEFTGTILPVNPRHRAVFGVWCHKSVADLPVAPDLALICSPPDTVVSLIERLAERGTGAAVVMTADPDARPGGGATPFRRALAEAARRTGVRILGPGSIGLQVPRIGLNASWITTRAAPGRLALVSQSATMTAGVVEWAAAKGVGFSHVISAGDAADVDLSEIFDHLGVHPYTRALLLLLKNLGEARSFMSAGRAIARLRPVVTLVADDCGDEEMIIFPSGEALAGVSQDAVHDAAIRRAGMVRVEDTDELLAAAETLATAQPLRGERVAIVGNGSGPGGFAAAIIGGGGGHVAKLAEATAAGILRIEGAAITPNGVIDLGRQADPARFAEGVGLLLKDSGIDAIMVMHVSTAVAPVAAVAEAVAQAVGRSTRTVLACFLGGETHAPVRGALAKAGIPMFATPEKAARAFLHLVHYRRNQNLLVQVPASVAQCSADGRQAARHIIDEALATGRGWLDESEALAVLTTYGLPMAPLAVAATPEEAARAAKTLGFPVALRLSMHGSLRQYSRDDVATDLSTPQGVIAAAQRVLAAVPETGKDGRPQRLLVQQLPHGTEAMTLTAGISSHDGFGLVVHVKGAKGDNVVAFPPLNLVLAQELLERAGITASVERSPWGRAIDQTALATVLVRLSELAIDLPEIRTLVIDPLLLSGEGPMALDARMVIGRPRPGRTHLAIHPYPRELIERAVLGGGRDFLIRPVRPEDEPGYRAMLAKLDPKDLYLRFCQHFGGNIGNVPITPLVHIDYDRQMTFVAELDGEIVGAVELTSSPIDSAGEYSIIIRSDLKGCGLGRRLMERIIAYARAKGYSAVFGLVLWENHGMQQLCRRLGFAVKESEDSEEFLRVELMIGDGSVRNQTDQSVH